jgi:2-haloacid dehalogenase
MGTVRSSVKAVVFDAYGTLFDVHALRNELDAHFPGQGGALSMLWRDKQLEYTRLRTLSNQYISFWEITHHALRYAVAALGQSLSADLEAQLMHIYARLPAYPEVSSTLARLRAAGLPLAILSNGNASMLQTVVQSAGLQGYFDHLLSVETVKRFKTDPQAYQLGPDAFGCAAHDMIFVSSNGWDAAGATWFGYRAFWVNRAGLPPEELGVVPMATGTSLADLTTFLGV